MSPDKNSTISFEPKSHAELASFFRENKDRYHEIRIILTNKKHTDPQPVSFTEAVEEAVKQSLIDSRTKTLSEQKYAIRFTKRKSPTHKSNKENSKQQLSG